MKTKQVFFIISGKDYSGAEIVLNRYLKNNDYIDPYIILIFKKESIINKFCNIYGAEKVYVLNLNRYQILNKIFPGLLSKFFWDEIASLISKKNPDIIYTNNSTESMIAGFLLKDINIPIVAHVHDMVSSMRNPLRKYGLKKILNKFDHVITVSEACKKDLSIKQEISVVYNGLDKSYFVNEIEPVSKSKCFKIGFVGSIIKRKGVDVLVKALEILDQKRINFKCIFVYGSKNEKYYNKILNLLNKKEIIYEFKNNLSENEVKEFYKQIDLLVVPSRYDPLPTVIMEAMARGTLVVGTNVDGIPEMIGDQELLFAKESPENLAKLIKKINSWNSNQISSKKEVLLERAKTLFSDQNKVKNLNEILNSMI